MNDTDKAAECVGGPLDGARWYFSGCNWYAKYALYGTDADKPVNVPVYRLVPVGPGGARWVFVEYDRKPQGDIA